jgi:uncharacterized protein (TIGR00304 family)
MVDAVSVGFLLIFAGVLVILVAALRSSGEGSRVKGGAVVLAGPIPIAFGTDARWTSVAIALAIVLVVVTLILYRGLP